jgi:hypothetical protein
MCGRSASFLSAEAIARMGRTWRRPLNVVPTNSQQAGASATVVNRRVAFHKRIGLQRRYVIGI